MARTARPTASVTLQDVARQAGVSMATASRVLHGGDRVPREELRQSVLTAAADLGYQANAYAQALARSATNVVGAVVHDVADPYFASLASGIIRYADSQRLLVMLVNTYRDVSREVEYVAALRAQRVRAIVLVGSRVADQEANTALEREIRAFQEGGGSVACVTQRGLPAHTLQPQNRAGAKALARSLVALGHRRFAVLAGPAELLTARERLAGFREGLKAEAVDLDRNVVLRGPFTREGGYAAATDLVTRGRGPTCVFAVNDVMAVGAMMAFREAGLDIPRDISVAGFDDVGGARDTWPPLTTVRLPLRDMGYRAAELALDGGDTPRVERVPAEVVTRASTRRLGAR